MPRSQTPWSRRALSLVVGCALLITPAIALASPASAAAAADVPFSGTADLQHYQFSVRCDSCVPGSNTLGGRLGLDVSATWNPNVAMSELFSDGLLRQGDTLDLRDALLPLSGGLFPSPLTITWSASGDAGEYNTDPGDAPVFPNDGSEEHTVSAGASKSASVNCSFALDGDGNETCAAGMLIDVADIGGGITDLGYGAQINIGVTTTVVITPAGVVTSRTAIAGPQTLAGSAPITFHGPSPATVSDPLVIPCTVAAGTHLSYSYAAFSSSPEVTPSTSIGINLHFTGAGSPDDVNIPVGTIDGDSAVMNVSAPAQTIDLGAVQPDVDPPVADPGGDGSGHTYLGVEGATIAFNGAASGDPHCGSPSLAWDFGDGSTATGPTPSHTYLEEGVYHGTLTATDGAGLSATTPFVAVVADAPLFSTGTTLNATEGAPFGSVVVANFSDADPNGTVTDYTATIDWGDGTTSTGTITGTGPFVVTGSDTYAEEGTYAVKVAIDDFGGSTTTASTKATVADAPLTASGFTFKSANPVNRTVADFSDADPGGVVTDYTATIDWGDGATSAGTITGTGPFHVSGSHLYTGTGPFVVTTHVCDEGGACATAKSTLLLEYMTGRAFALSAITPLAAIRPTPDTDSVSTSGAFTGPASCVVSAATLFVDTRQLCANVTTALNPGTVSSTAWETSDTVGLVGMPVVKIGLVQSTSTTSCTGATGTATIASLQVGGLTLVPRPTAVAPNTVINLGLMRVVLNEQLAVSGADKGLTVNAVHITGLFGDVVFASTTSAIHNCP